MNYKAILGILSNMMLLEAFFFIPSMGLAIYDGEIKILWSFIITAIILLALSVVLRLISRKNGAPYFTREGFLLVGLSWIVLSAFGALPFVISGEIPNFIDAFFETVSGFTTTGSSILRDVEAMSRPLLLWRSFTHWMGGMGILVFMLAVVPSGRGKGESVYVLRAESPGPSIEKIVPKIKQHAMILYSIYMVMTVICFLFLLAGGMPVFDNICITLGTAGTGGFGIKNDSIASYSPYCQIIITIFMALFGVNFNIYFYIILRRFKSILKDEELRAYIFMFVGATAIITLNIFRSFSTVGEALRHASFTVSSVMTTTGYATTDFDKWPELSRAIILFLMIIGASAGSTGGGFKVSRLILILKSGVREVKKLLHPRAVIPVRMNGQVISKNVIHSVNVYTAVYMTVVIASFLAVSIDNFSLETNLSAVISCVSNIGPGLGAVGPAGNFADYSYFSKIILSLDMLIGRLEIFPLMILFFPRTWRRVT